MGSHICVVDHTESLGNRFGEVSCQGFIAYSGHPEAVELVDRAENLLDIKCSQHSKCSTQRKPSNPDLGSPVERSERLHILPDIALDALESIIEPLMHQASTAARILNLRGIQIGNPILDINLALERHNDGIHFLREACIPVDIEDVVCEGFGLG